MSEKRPGGYAVVRSDSSPAKAAEDAQDAREFGKDVRVSAGGMRFTIPAALIASLATGAGTWLATRNTTAPSDYASRGDVNALQKQVSEANAAIVTLTATVTKNADTARNENVALSSVVGQNARDQKAATDRMSDKLDLFMRINAQR